ncbi:hypothetical protein MRY24_24430, partial [Escherichia coli]|nr:hypothetical protein [Salmonella enterica subsp. enterica serovar Typhimurium]MCI4943554.1 hypothetical protein [Escherichia coli]MCI4948245.1 hypothetical protein [Escherichia coli]MCI4981710.1 hypothetical protein [Escherichia coli]
RLCRAAHRACALGLSRPSPRRYGASSAFPTLTGLVALAAGLAAVYGPANAPERGRLREGAESYAKALASDILR